MGFDGRVFAGGDDSSVQALIAQRLVSRSGPLPDPEDLAGFERALPGCAERIVRMAEKAQDAAIEDGHLSTRADQLEKAERNIYDYATVGLAASGHMFKEITGLRVDSFIVP